MKIYRNILMLAVLLIAGAQAWTQQGALKLNINYTAGIPTGNFKTSVNQTSWRGWDAALMYGVTDQLSLGLQTGSQDFYQKYPRQVVHESGSDISAVITNSIQVMPVMLKAKYLFNTTNTLQPYAALGVGGNLINYNKYYGEFNDSKDAFQFAAQPEVGLNIPVGVARKVAFNLSAGYNIMPFKYNEVNGLNNIVAKAGISFAVR